VSGQAPTGEGLDEIPAAFWSHRWGRAGVYPALVVCLSCLVRADRPDADQWCDHTCDLAHAATASPQDAPSAGRRTSPADGGTQKHTDSHAANPQPLANAFHTQPAWVSAEEDR